MNDLASGKIRLMIFVGFVVVSALSALALVFLWLAFAERDTAEVAGGVFYILNGTLLAAVAVPICLRQSRNPVGWIMLFAGFLLTLQSFTQDYSVFAWFQHGGRLPGTMLLTWISQWTWLPPYTFFMLLLLLFPTGRLLSAPWRWVAGAVVVTTMLLAILVATSSPMTVGLPGMDMLIPNPVGLWELPAERWEFLFGFFWLPLLLLIALSATSIALRWRRAGSAERQQIRVVVYALILIVIVLIGGTFIESPWYDLVVDGMFLLLPIAFAVAILRYRLYDIDVVIRKTLVYAVLTGLLALVYFGSIIVLQQLFTTRTGQEDSAVAVVLSTLLIAALFTPLRSRIQKIIDRRFFRQRYDAQQVLASFGATIRNETDPDQLTVELLRVVQETMQPISVRVWIRPGGNTPYRSKVGDLE